MTMAYPLHRRRRRHALHRYHVLEMQWRRFSPLAAQKDPVSQLTVPIRGPNTLRDFAVAVNINILFLSAYINPN